ncbi:MAG: response regulator [Hydrogenoanaerobacterium sp.]
MKSKIKKYGKKIAIKKFFIISTIALSTMLIIFLVVTANSTRELNKQIQLSIEHQSTVSLNMGEVRTNLAQMRIHTEHLNAFNDSVNIAIIRADIKVLHQNTEKSINEIKRLYLGPAKDCESLEKTFSEIKKNQNELLKYAESAFRSPEQITEYKSINLYPLYEQMESFSNIILNSIQDDQLAVLHFANDLSKISLLLSSILVIITIFGFILFLYYLNKTNQKLFYKNQQFDILSHTIDEAFMIFAPESDECDFVAENSLRVLGIPFEALKKSRQEFYKNVDSDVRGDIKKKLFTAEGNYSCEMPISYHNPKTQELRWLFARFYQFGENEHTKYIITLVDETDDILAQHALKDALANAQNANNAKRDFLSRMSHEIRTPMNAIIGMTTIAGAAIDDKTRVEDCLAKISYSSKHLLMLINDILDMSKIESNKLSINNEPFDLYQFVNSFVSVAYTQAHAKGIKFTENMLGFAESTTYLGDSLRLNQILLNLTSNAIKFTEEGGSILLQVKRIPSQEKSEHIRFTVTDTGIGMTEEAVSRIYLPFDQANATISKKYGGTGLGMSITKNLVTLMGGCIDVKSSLGKGTICTVELPFEKSDTMLDALPEEKLKGLNVLVVDDEQDMCEHTTLLLAKINIRAQWVLSGAKAVEEVTEAYNNGDSFDVCFIDWNMPNMDGIETTRKIRESVGSETPIIIITAYDWSDIEEKARAAGANAFISKPLFLSSIYNSLVNVTNGAFARAAAKPFEIKDMLIGKRLLVAEDNALNLEIAEEILKMSGATVECAHNGQEALDIFAASQPEYFDAILMDVQMPIMDGYEATQNIRKLNRQDAQKVPIIATTANAFTEDISAAIAAGMDSHLSKPIDIKQLYTELSKLINKAHR